MFKLKKHPGSAAIMTITAVMLLAAVGGFFVMLTSSNMKAASEFQNTYSAQYAAEAGAKIALAMFAAGSPNWNMLSTETEVLGFAGAYYQAQIIPNLTDTQLPTPGNTYKVTATGKYKSAVKIISFTVTVTENASLPLVSNWQ